MKQIQSTIRIVAVPPGEAPFWVRQQWVGLELPLNRHPTPHMVLGFGILSSPRTWLGQMWATVRGRAQYISGYPVEASRAVDILETSSPEAAAWWLHDVPHLIAPKRYLLFHAEVCEIIDATSA